MRLPTPDYLQAVWDACVLNTGGAVAHYIPQLAEVDPERFGILQRDLALANIRTAQ